MTFRAWLKYRSFSTDRLLVWNVVQTFGGMESINTETSGERKRRVGRQMKWMPPWYPFWNSTAHWIHLCRSAFELKRKTNKQTEKYQDRRPTGGLNQSRQVSLFFFFSKEEPFFRWKMSTWSIPREEEKKNLISSLGWWEQWFRVTLSTEIDKQPSSFIYFDREPSVV